MKLKARNRIVTGALLLLVLLVVIGALLSGAPPARAAETFTIEGGTPPLGMATDPEHERYWLLDRAAGRLQLTAVGADGTVQGRMSSRDTLSHGRGLAFEAGEAFVGDMGAARKEVTIHKVPQPWPGTEILAATPYRLTYPDGARTGAALFVDRDQRIHIVTTGEGAGIYRAPATLEPDTPSPLERVADVPDGVTGGVVLADGRIVLRTATTLFTLDPTTFATAGEAEIGVEQRGQVVAESLTRGEVVTGVGPQGEVTSSAVPGPQPTTSSSPRPVRTVVPTPTDDPADPTRTFEQSGTTMALIAALILAGLAALVVLIRR